MDQATQFKEFLHQIDGNPDDPQLNYLFYVEAGTSVDKAIQLYHSPQFLEHFIPCKNGDIGAPEELHAQNRGGKRSRGVTGVSDDIHHGSSHVSGGAAGVAITMDDSPPALRTRSRGQYVQYVQTPGLRLTPATTLPSVVTPHGVDLTFAHDEQEQEQEAGGLPTAPACIAPIGHQYIHVDQARDAIETSTTAITTTTTTTTPTPTSNSIVTTKRRRVPPPDDDTTTTTTTTSTSTRRGNWRDTNPNTIGAAALAEVVDAVVQLGLRNPLPPRPLSAIPTITTSDRHHQHLHQHSNNSSSSVPPTWHITSLNTSIHIAQTPPSLPRLYFSATTLQSVIGDCIRKSQWLMLIITPYTPVSGKTWVMHALNDPILDTALCTVQSACIHVNPMVAAMLRKDWGLYITDEPAALFLHPRTQLTPMLLYGGRVRFHKAYQSPLSRLVNYHLLRGSREHPVQNKRVLRPLPLDGNGTMDVSKVMPLHLFLAVLRAMGELVYDDHGVRFRDEVLVDNIDHELDALVRIPRKKKTPQTYLESLDIPELQAIMRGDDDDHGGGATTSDSIWEQEHDSLNGIPHLTTSTASTTSTTTSTTTSSHSNTHIHLDALPRVPSMNSVPCPSASYPPTTTTTTNNNNHGDQPK